MQEHKLAIYRLTLFPICPPRCKFSLDVVEIPNQATTRHAGNPGNLSIPQWLDIKLDHMCSRMDGKPLDQARKPGIVSCVIIHKLK